VELRRQCGFGLNPISNDRLTELAGFKTAAIDDVGSSDAPFSFEMPVNRGFSQIVLPSDYPTSRRFNLARIIGDRLSQPHQTRFHPATRAHTSRQQAQRSFAAEFLSPFPAVEAMLNGDYSPERQRKIAEHFLVSEMTINSMLKNHGVLARDEADYDSITAVA
jgi:hypothetical protein